MNPENWVMAGWKEEPNYYHRFRLVLEGGH